MKINLNALSIFMIILGVLVLLVGRNFSGYWLYSLILIIAGLGWMLKGKSGKNKK